MGDWSNNLEYEQREYYGHFYDTDEDVHEEETEEETDDLISRKDAIQELKAGGLEELFKSLGVYPWNVIKMIPSADVRENIHGTWEEWKVGKYEGVPICSVCKHGFPLGFNQYNFCPNCGADMRGET